MTELNGKSTLPPDPTLEIAQEVFAALCDEGETWEDLAQQDVADEVMLAEHYVQAHLRALARHGLRIVPTHGVPVPQSDEEAAAYIAAARAYAQAKKRKTTLLTRPGLILPQGSKVQ